MNKFEIKDDFYLNGSPFKIISGAIHYFRIVPNYWRDRLEKLKAMGCNTLETYVPWNVHEPKKGEFHFDEMADLCGFLDIADELGLYVILRPSPYICAEWEFGGLPAWLLAEDNMVIRGNDPVFLKHVDDYFKELFPRIDKYQGTKGGPIIMMQIENEYGYFGDDGDYMAKLHQMMLDHHVEVPLVTSDGPWGDALECGRIKGILPTGNFGSKMKEQFDNLKRYTDGGPLMCMEFWIGWFDHWGSDRHVISDLEQNCLDLREGLTYGHLNIYMFIGGTNFGFMNGSNNYDKLEPDVTSYDYDATLSEDGRITEKYKAFQEIIGEFTNLPQVELTSQIKQKAYGELSINEKVSLFEVVDLLAKAKESTFPVCMEKLGQSYGYVLYESVLKKEKDITSIHLWDTNDRAQVFVDEERLITLYDKELLEDHQVKSKPSDCSKIKILVENMGRVNFGPKMGKQRKGIDGTVQINGHGHTHWKQYPLELNNLENLDFNRKWIKGIPGFYRFTFTVDEIADSFIDMEGWGKGCVFVNDFNLGRFWEIGPQRCLYLPGPLLKIGDNEIIVFETEGKTKDFIYLTDKANIGTPKKNDK